MALNEQITYSVLFERTCACVYACIFSSLLFALFRRVPFSMFDGRYTVLCCMCRACCQPQNGEMPVDHQATPKGKYIFSRHHLFQCLGFFFTSIQNSATNRHQTFECVNLCVYFSLAKQKIETIVIFGDLYRAFRLKIFSTSVRITEK